MKVADANYNVVEGINENTTSFMQHCMHKDLINRIYWPNKGYVLPIAKHYGKA